MKLMFCLAGITIVTTVGCHSVSVVASSSKSGTDFSWPAAGMAGKPLTSEQCVAIALWNQPDYRAVLAELGVSKAETIKAGQIANPTLAMFLPSSAKVLEFTAKLPVELLWLRPKRQKISNLDFEATARRLEQAGADVARDVRVAFARVQMLTEQIECGEQSATVFGELLRIAEVKHQAGESSELAVAQSRADGMQAAHEVRRLRLEQMVASERLRSLLGMALQAEAIRVNKRATVDSAVYATQVAVDVAIRSRPDVRAAELGVTAAACRAGLMKDDVLALTASAKFTDGAGTQSGFELPLPIFHQNQAARVAADAQLAKAMCLLASARHRAAAETREALTRLQQARSVADGWGGVLSELESVLAKSRMAVAEGDAPPFLALDAARRLAEARYKAAESKFHHAEASAELRRAMGST